MEPPENDFEDRLDDPAKFVSPYPSFYEGPRIDLGDELQPEHHNPTAGVKNDDDTTLFVGNLDQRVTETMLYELFSQIGHIRDVTFPKQDLEKTAFFCFINFAHVESVPHAIKTMQGNVLFGRRVNLRCRPNSVHADKYGFLHKQTSRKDRSVDYETDKCASQDSVKPQQRRVVILRGSDIAVVQVKTENDQLKEPGGSELSSVVVLPPKPAEATSPKIDTSNLSPVSEASLHDLESPRNIAECATSEPTSSKGTENSDTTGKQETRRNVVFKSRNNEMNQSMNYPPRYHQQGPFNNAQPHPKNSGYPQSNAYNYGAPGPYYPIGAPPHSPYTSGVPAVASPNFNYYNQYQQSYQPQYWDFQSWNYNGAYPGANGYTEPLRYTYARRESYSSEQYYGGYPPPPAAENQYGYSRSQYQWVNSNQVHWNNNQNNYVPESPSFELIQRSHLNSHPSSKSYSTEARRSRSRSPSARRCSKKASRRSRSRSYSRSPRRSHEGYRSSRSHSTGSHSHGVSAHRRSRSVSKERSGSRSSPSRRSNPVPVQRRSSSASERSSEDDSRSEKTSSCSRRRQKFASEKYSSGDL